MAEFEQDIIGVGSPKFGGYILADNPTPTKAGEFGWDPTLKRPTFGDGTATQLVPTQKDLDKKSLFRGELSVKSGSLPDKNSGSLNKGIDLVAGTYWFITEAGTLTGIKGDVDLKVGAFLYLLGATATAADSFFGQNTDEDTSSFLLDGVTTKDVTNGTDILFAPPAKIKRITSCAFELSTGAIFYPEIKSFVRSGTGIGVTITPKMTRTAVSAYFIGAAV